MSRVIQLISHNQHLFALTDAGEIFATPSVLNAKWSLFEGPQLSSQPYCQASASDESFAIPGQREDSLQTFHCVEPEDSPDFNSLNGPGQGVYRTRHRTTPVFRRPTSIGSDGNYLPPLGD